MAIAAASGAIAAEPKVAVEFTDKGELNLTLDGKPISQPTWNPNPTVRFRDPAATVPIWGLDENLWPVVGADCQPRSNVFDTAQRRLTQTFAWGEVVRTYRVVRGGVDIEVTVHNQSPKTLCEFQQRLFTLKLPYETGPAMTTEALYFGQCTPAGSGDTLSGPVALPLVGGAGYADNRGQNSRAIVATTPETKRHLELRWDTDTWLPPWDPKKVSSYAANDPAAMDLAARQGGDQAAAKGEHWWLTLSVGGDRLLYHDRYTSRPIPPGGSDTYQVWLRFGDASDPLAPAKEALKAYGKAHPMKFHWPDRRPVIPCMIGDGFPFHEPGAVTLTKPEGVTASAEFRDRLLKQADELIAKMKRLNAQGVIVWNIEGNAPPQIKYVGDPHMIEYMCPEADAVADEFFKKIRDAGFRVGVCLRPSVIGVGTLAGNPWLKSQNPDAKSPFAFFHEPNPGPAYADILSAKVEYAKKRWGCTLFYVDTNEAAGLKPTPQGGMAWYQALLNEDVWAEVLRRHPDVLFTIEHTPLIQYTVCAPYDEWQYPPDGTPSVVRATWPDAFKFIVIRQPKDIWQMAAKVRDGDVICEGGETAQILSALGAVLKLEPPKELAGLTPSQLLVVATDSAASAPARFFATKKLCAGKVDAATADKLLAGGDPLVQLVTVEALHSRDQLREQISRLLRLPGGPYGFFGGTLRDAASRGGAEFLRDLGQYAHGKPEEASGVINWLWVTPDGGATEALAALVADATLPADKRFYAASVLGWRGDASAAQKDLALDYLLAKLNDPAAQRLAAITLRDRYVQGHGAWHKNPRLRAAAVAAAEKERQKPGPDPVFLEALTKIIEGRQ